MVLTADAIRSKLGGGGPGISMAELGFLIGDGFNRRSGVTGMDRKMMLGGGWKPGGVAEDKPVKVDTEKIARDLKAKQERDAYMAEINSWCRTIKKAQTSHLKRQGWTDKQIAHFMNQIAIDNKFRRRGAADEPDFEHEYTPPRDDSHQDLLRGMFKFDRKHTPQFTKKTNFTRRRK